MIATVAIVKKINYREMSLDLYTEKPPEIIIVFSLWKGLIVFVPVAIMFYFMACQYMAFKKYSYHCVDFRGKDPC